MKRYKLIDNKTNKTYEYSWLEWNIAWVLVYVFGFLTCKIIFL